MDLQKTLEELKVLGPQAASIAATIQEVVHSNKKGDITKEEAEYLLSELKEAKVALDLANNEIATRLAVEAIDFVMSVLL